jgi:subtilisin family serine protease
MDPALRELMERSREDDIEAIVRLAPDGVVPPDMRLVARFGDIATCRLPRGRIADVRAEESVRSLKAARPFGADPAPAVPADAAETAEASDEEMNDQRRPEGLTATGRGTVVAVVDWGFDFAHTNFRRADGTTRALAFWDQRAPGPGPAPYGYGRVYTREAIDQALRSDDPYAALGYHPATGAPSEGGAHGTHVLDIAAGNGRADGAPMGIAPESELIFVHLADRGTEGLASLGNSVTLLEALDWIRRQAGDRPWVVNLSMGRHGGEHTGQTLVEQAIDALLAESPGRCVIHSAGNYFRARTHASGRLRPGERRVLDWRIDPADVTPNELEIWYPGRDVFTLELLGPGGGPMVRLGLGETAAIEHEGRIVGRAYHRAHDPMNQDHHIDLFLYPEAPPGRWEVALSSEDVTDGRFHAWVERDSGNPRCQSYLEAEDVTTTATTGTIANGFRSIAVGAYDAHSPEWEIAPFSSSGPTRDGRIKPDLVAPGVRVLATRSASRELGADTPLLMRSSGTSMAAPHVTGTVALLFEVVGRPLSIQETRRLLLSTTEPAAPEWAERAGSGYLNIERALAAAEDLGAGVSSQARRNEPHEEEESPEPEPERVDGEGLESACACEATLYPAECSCHGPVPGETEDIFDEALPSPAAVAAPPADLLSPVDDRAIDGVELADAVPHEDPESDPEDLLPRLLEHVGAAELTGVEGGMASPAMLFDAFVSPGQVALQRHFAQFFEVLALPGEAPPELRPGDVLVRRALGEGGLGHVAMLTSEGRWRPGEVPRLGLAAEGQRPGWYAPVLEASPRLHTSRTPVARRILDDRGRVPAEQLLLRLGPVRASHEVAAESEIEPAGAPAALSPHDLIHPHIDVDAQRALRRMSQGDEAARRDAAGMLTAVRTGALAGLYAADQQAPALRARRMDLYWWQLIPAGEDGALVLEPGAPMAPLPLGEQAPMIIFRDAIRSQPERLDRALRKAWASFALLQAGQLGTCELDLPGPDGMSAQEQTLTGLSPIANIVPALCQLRRQRPQPQRPRPQRPQPQRPRPQRPRPGPTAKSDPWYTADSLSNILLFPTTKPPRIVEGPLAAVRGGLFTDASLRPRVSAILGPGATPLGVARTLLPLYQAAARGSSVAVALTEDELARGILVYNELYLPLSDLRKWRDGLRLPLPIEIDVQTGDWVLNSRGLRLWASTFPSTAAPHLTKRPTHLEQPDESALAREVQDFLQNHTNPLAQGIALNARALTNPFEVVFLFFALFREKRLAAFDMALAFLDQAVNHQLELLASLTAGNGILDRLREVLRTPPASLSPTQQANLQRGLGMLQRALGTPQAVVPRELPETREQLARRPGRVPFGGLPQDPREGSHRIVLGRDVLAGAIGTFRKFTGPAYVGRIPPRPFFDTHRTSPLFPQGDPRFAARAEIVLAIAGNEGFLDGIRMQDAGILSTGIQQWSAHSEPELPAFLHRFKALAPDEFRLFFRLYNLEVQQVGTGFTLRQVRPDGTVVDLPVSDRRRFFGGTRAAGGQVTFETHWAARVRAASIASVAYKVAQVLEGAARFDRIRNQVGDLRVTLAGRRRTLPLEQVITSKLGAALILDSHINAPGNVRADLQASARAAGNQPNADRLDRAITADYMGRRRLIHRDQRNQRIRGLQLSAAHGSFTGW